MLDLSAFSFFNNAKVTFYAASYNAYSSYSNAASIGTVGLTGFSLNQDPKQIDMQVSIETFDQALA